MLGAQEGLDTQGAALDLMYQGLEHLSSKAGPAEIAKAITLFKGALDQYPSLGDAYYYRQLCLKKLGENEDRQKLDKQAAERYESQALRDGRDPFTLAVPRIYENLGAVGQKWALVVGISRFKSEDPLDYAAPDATAFAAALKDSGIGRFSDANVTLLTNQQATTAAIKAKLNAIARQAKPEDLVVVYISTHGSPRSDDLRRVSYLMTYDTDTANRDTIFGSALPMVEISGILCNRCVAQRSVTIFDTCHSGAADPGQALSAEDLDQLREGAGRYVLSSCQADQIAYEGDGHGYFTASLIRQLSERKGCVRLSDLFAQVREEVQATVQQKYGKQQRPVMARSDSAAEIVLGTPPGKAPESCAA
jgi:hypothetical protein